MKLRQILLIAALLTALLAGAALATAAVNAGYTLSWFTVDGGGGTSTGGGGGGYSVSGTIGQPDAGILSSSGGGSGGYTLHGGFWGGVGPVRSSLYLPLVRR